MNAAANDQLLTAAGLAAESGVPQLTIRNWCRRGLLPFRTDTSGRRIFDAASVKRAKELRNRKTYRFAPQ